MQAGGHRFDPDSLHIGRQASVVGRQNGWAAMEQVGSTGKKNLDMSDLAPRAWAGLVVFDRRSSTVCLWAWCGGVLLVFVSVNQVLVRLWACCGQFV